MSQAKPYIPAGTVLLLANHEKWDEMPRGELQREKYIVMYHSKSMAPVAIQLGRWHPDINIDHMRRPQKYARCPLYYQKMANWAPKQARDFGTIDGLPCTGWALMGRATAISPELTQPLLKNRIPSVVLQAIDELLEESSTNMPAGNVSIQLLKSAIDDRCRDIGINNTDLLEYDEIMSEGGRWNWQDVVDLYNLRGWIVQADPEQLQFSK